MLRERNGPVPPFNRFEREPLSSLAAGEWLRKPCDGVEQVLANELRQSDWVRRRSAAAGGHERGRGGGVGCDCGGRLPQCGELRLDRLEWLAQDTECCC